MLFVPSCSCAAIVGAVRATVILVSLESKNIVSGNCFVRSCLQLSRVRSSCAVRGIYLSRSLLALAMVLLMQCLDICWAVRDFLSRIRHLNDLLHFRAHCQCMCACSLYISNVPTPHAFHPAPPHTIPPLPCQQAFCLSRHQVPEHFSPDPGLGHVLKTNDIVRSLRPRSVLSFSTCHVVCVL